jgi:PKD repeat protein
VALTVTDDDGAKDKEVIYITVRNLKPSVEIQEEALEISEDELFKLHGIVNDTESDVGSLELAWDFDDGNGLSWDSDNYVATHKFQNQGSYTVELKVKDDDGSVNKTTTEVRVFNVDPVAEFSMSATTIWEDEIIYFDAADTTDTRSDLANLEYYWDFGDQMTEMGRTVAHSFIYSGIFQVTLTVIDDDNAESKVSYFVTVNNVRPEAIITTEVLEAYVGQEVNFSADGSRDSKTDLERLIYEWEFEDGVTDSLKNTKYTFSRAGEYTVTLKVTDDNGDTSYASVIMKIRSMPESDSTTSRLLDLGETEGLLFLFMIIVIIVLVLMLLLFFMRQSAGRKKSPHAKGRRTQRGHVRQPSAPLRAHHATYYMTNNQMGPQHQYAVHDHHMMRPQPPPDLPPPWFRPSANEPQQRAQHPSMGASQEGFGQAQQHPYPGFYPPQLPQQAAGPNGLHQNVGYNGQIPPVVEGEVLRADELQLGSYPALPPSEEEPAPQPLGTKPTDELKPSVEVVEAAESEKSNDKKFCGTCGEPVQSSQWFICPSCKNVL